MALWIVAVFPVVLLTSAFLVGIAGGRAGLYVQRLLLVVLLLAVGLAILGVLAAALTPYFLILTAVGIYLAALTSAAIIFAGAQQETLWPDAPWDW